MTGLWNRVTAWFETNVPSDGFRLRPGAAAEEISNVERAMGIALPHDVRESYLLHDGGSGGAFFESFDLLPLHRILDAYRFMAGSLELQEAGHIPTWATHPDGPIKPVMWHPNWIPIMDCSGDRVCIDLAPEPGGRTGQVIEHSHEVGPVRVMADSFSSWLSHTPTIWRPGSTGSIHSL